MRKSRCFLTRLLIVAAPMALTTATASSTTKTMMRREAMLPIVQDRKFGKVGRCYEGKTTGRLGTMLLLRLRGDDVVFRSLQ